MTIRASAVHARRMENPEYAKAYEESGPAMEIAFAMAEARAGPASHRATWQGHGHVPSQGSPDGRGAESVLDRLPREVRGRNRRASGGQAHPPGRDGERGGRRGQTDQAGS